MSEWNADQRRFMLAALEQVGGGSTAAWVMTCGSLAQRALPLTCRLSWL